MLSKKEGMVERRHEKVEATRRHDVGEAMMVVMRL